MQFHQEECIEIHFQQFSYQPVIKDSKFETFDTVNGRILISLYVISN